MNEDYFLKSKNVVVAPKDWIELSNTTVKVFPKRDRKHISFHLRTNLLIHPSQNFSSFEYLKFIQAKCQFQPSKTIEFNFHSYPDRSEFNYEDQIRILDIHFWTILPYFHLESRPCNIRIFLGFEFPNKSIFCDISRIGLIRKMFDERLLKYKMG